MQHKLDKQGLFVISKPRRDGRLCEAPQPTVLEASTTHKPLKPDRTMEKARGQALVPFACRVLAKVQASSNHEIYAESISTLLDSIARGRPLSLLSSERQLGAALRSLPPPKGMEAILRLCAIAMAAAEGDIGDILRLAVAPAVRCEPHVRAAPAAAAAADEMYQAAPDAAIDTKQLIRMIARQVSPWSIRPSDCLPITSSVQGTAFSFAGYARSRQQLVWSPSGWMATSANSISSLNGDAVSIQLPLSLPASAVLCSEPRTGAVITASVAESVLSLHYCSQGLSAHSLHEEKLDVDMQSTVLISMSCSADGSLQLLTGCGDQLHMRQWELISNGDSRTVEKPCKWLICDSSWAAITDEAASAFVLQALGDGLSLIHMQLPGTVPHVSVVRKPIRNVRAEYTFHCPVHASAWSGICTAAGHFSGVVEACGVDWISGRLHLAVRHGHQLDAIVDVALPSVPVFKQALQPAHTPASDAVVAGTCVLLAAASQHAQLVTTHGSAQLQELMPFERLLDPTTFESTVDEEGYEASGSLVNAPAVQGASRAAAAVAPVPDDQLDSRKEILFAGKDFKGGQQGYSGPPWALMGCDVAVLWAGEQWFDGTVTRFDPSSGRHFVQYKDGDERWYAISEKTFKVLAVPSLTEDELTRLRSVADSALAAARSMASTTASAGGSDGDASQAALLVWDCGAQVPLLERGQGAPEARETGTKAVAAVQACLDEANQAAREQSTEETPKVRLWEPLAVDLRDGAGMQDVPQMIFDLAKQVSAHLQHIESSDAQPKDSKGAAWWLSKLPKASVHAVLAQVCSLLASHDIVWQMVHPTHSGESVDVLQRFAPHKGEPAAAAAASDSKVQSPALAGATSDAAVNDGDDRDSWQMFGEIMKQDQSSLFDKGLADAHAQQFEMGAVHFAALACQAGINQAVSAYNAACLLAQSDCAPKHMSLRWLRLAGVLGYSNSADAREDPDFETVRDHVTFEAVLEFIDLLHQARSAVGVPRSASVPYSLDSTEHVLVPAPHISSGELSVEHTGSDTGFCVQNWKQELKALLCETVRIWQHGHSRPPRIELGHTDTTANTSTPAVAVVEHMPSALRFLVESSARLYGAPGPKVHALEVRQAFLSSLQAYLINPHWCEAELHQQERVLVALTLFVLQKVPHAAGALLPGMMNLQHTDNGTVAGLLTNSTYCTDLLQSLWSQLLCEVVSPLASSAQQDGLEQKVAEVAAEEHSADTIPALLMRLQSRLLAVPQGPEGFDVPSLALGSTWLRRSLWYLNLVLSLLMKQDCVTAIKKHGVAALVSGALDFYSSCVLPELDMVPKELAREATAAPLGALNKVAAALCRYEQCPPAVQDVRTAAMRSIALTLQLFSPSSDSDWELQSPPAHSSYDEIQSAARSADEEGLPKSGFLAAFQRLLADPAGNVEAISTFSQRILQQVAAQGLRPPMLPGSMKSVHDTAFCAAILASVPWTCPENTDVQQWLLHCASGAEGGAVTLPVLSAPAVVGAFKTALAAGSWAVAGWKAGRVLHELAIWVYGVQHMPADTPFASVLLHAGHLDSDRLQAFCSLLFTESEPPSMPEALREAVNSCGKSTIRSFFGVTAFHHAASQRSGQAHALLSPTAHEDSGATASQAQVEARISFAVRCISATLKHNVWRVVHTASGAQLPAERFAVQAVVDRASALLNLATPSKPCSAHSIQDFLCAHSVQDWQPAASASPSGLATPVFLLSFAGSSRKLRRAATEALGLSRHLVGSLEAAIGASGNQAGGADMDQLVHEVSAVVWCSLTTASSHQVTGFPHGDDLQVAALELLVELQRLVSTLQKVISTVREDTAVRGVHLFCTAVASLGPALGSSAASELSEMLHVVLDMQEWLISQSTAIGESADAALSFQEKTSTYWRAGQRAASGSTLLHQAMQAALSAEATLVDTVEEKHAAKLVAVFARRSARLLSQVRCSDLPALPAAAPSRRQIETDDSKEEESGEAAESKDSDVVLHPMQKGPEEGRVLPGTVAESWRAVEGLVFRSLCAVLQCQHGVLCASYNFAKLCQELSTDECTLLLSLCTAIGGILGSQSYVLPSRPWTQHATHDTEGVLCGGHPLLTPRVNQAMLVAMTAVLDGLQRTDVLQDASRQAIATQLLQCAGLCMAQEQRSLGYSYPLSSLASSSSVQCLRQLTAAVSRSTHVSADLGGFGAGGTEELLTPQKHAAVWPTVSVRVSSLFERAESSTVAIPLLSQAAEQLCAEVAATFVSPQNKEQPNQNTASELRRRMLAAVGTGGSSRSAAQAMRQALLSALGVPQDEGGLAGGASTASSSAPNVSEALHQSIGMYSALWSKWMDGSCVPLTCSASGGISVSSSLCVAMSFSAVQEGRRNQSVTASTVKPQLTPAVVWEVTNETRRTTIVSKQLVLPSGGSIKLHALVRSGETKCLGVLELDAYSKFNRPPVQLKHGVVSVDLPSSLALAQSLVGTDSPQLLSAWRALPVDDQAQDSSTLMAALESMQGVDLDFTSILEPGKVGVAMSEAQALASVTSSPLLPGRVPQRTPAQRMRLAIDTELRHMLLEKIKQRFGGEAGIGAAPSRNAGRDAIARMLGIPAGALPGQAAEDTGSGFLRNVPDSMSGFLGRIARGGRAPPQPPATQEPQTAQPSERQPEPSSADVFEELARDSFALDGETLNPDGPASQGSATPSLGSPLARGLAIDSLIPGGNKSDPAHVLKISVPEGFKRTLASVKQFVDSACAAVRQSDFPKDTLDALRGSLMRQMDEHDHAIVAKGPLSLCTSAAHHLAAAGVRCFLSPLPAQGTPREALALNGSQARGLEMMVMVPGAHQGPLRHALASLCADGVVLLSQGSSAIQQQVISAFTQGKTPSAVSAAGLCLGGRLSVLGPLEVGQVARVLPFELDVSAPPKLQLTEGGVSWADADGSVYHRVWLDASQGLSNLLSAEQSKALDGAMVRIVSRSAPWNNDHVLVQLVAWGLHDADDEEALPVGIMAELPAERLASVSSSAALSVAGISGAVSGQLHSTTLAHAGSIDLWSDDAHLTTVLSACLSKLKTLSTMAVGQDTLVCACILLSQLSLAAHMTGRVKEAAQGWTSAHADELSSALAPLLSQPAAQWAASAPVLSGQVPAALSAVQHWCDTAWAAGTDVKQGSTPTPTSAQEDAVAQEAAVDLSLMQQLPSDVDSGKLFSSFAVQAPHVQATSTLSPWAFPQRFSSSVQFAGFKNGQSDPRRAGKAGFRASEQVVFPANRSWPQSTEWANLRFAYFEATIVHSERSSGQSSPAVRIGLWSDNELSRGFAHGCEWGPGSVVYCGESGRAGRWRYTTNPASTAGGAAASDLPSSRPTASPTLQPSSPSVGSAPLRGEKPCVPNGSLCLDVGSVVEARDEKGQVTWRPARIIDSRPGQRLVHYQGWNAEYDEWINADSDRFAVCGTNLSACVTGGFVEEVAFGPVWGTRGDTVGCLWDRSTGTVAFTRNGRYLGVAATEVWGVFTPAVSSENQSAGVTMNFGGAPFVWTGAPPQLDALQAGGQSAPALHTSALDELVPDAAVLEGAFMLRKHAAAHAARLDAAVQVVAAMNERRQKLNRPRPVPYPNFEMRNMARDLKEMLPPEASEAMVMRVLKLCHGDRGLAAEHLLTHMSTLMGATAQTAALEAADREGLANASFVEFLYASPGRTDRYVDHNVSGFGGVPPPAPGLTGRVVLAQPEHAQRTLENAEEVKGNIVLVRRGECTFVQKMQRAQEAGAVAVLLVNTQGSGMFVPDGGSDDTSSLDLPMALVSYQDGEDILACNSSDSGVQVNIRMGLEAPPSSPGAAQSAAQSQGDSQAADGADDIPGDEDECKADVDTAPGTLRPVARSSQVHAQGYGCGRGRIHVLGSVHSASAADGILPRSEPHTLRLPWSACADAVVGSAALAGSSEGSSLRDSMNKLIPAAGVSGSGVMADGLMVGDRPAGAAAPAAQVSPQDQWIAGVERSMSLRRVPAGVIAMVLDLLRQGGENQIAIARSMLEDVGISLPAPPDADSGGAGAGGAASGNMPASPGMRPAASPFSGPAGGPPSLLRGRSSTGGLDSPGLPPLPSPLQRSTSSAGGSRVFSTAPPIEAAAGGLPPRHFLPGQMVAVTVTPTELQLVRSQLGLRAAAQLAAPPGSALGTLPRTPGTPARPLQHLPPYLEVQFKPAGAASTFVHGTIERHVPPGEAGGEHLYDVVTDSGDAEANVALDRLQVRDVKDRHVWVPARTLLGSSASAAAAPTAAGPRPTALSGSTLRAAVSSLSCAALLLSPLDACSTDQQYSAWASEHDSLCELQGRVLQIEAACGAVQVAFIDQGTGAMVSRWLPSSQLRDCPQPVLTESLLGTRPRNSREAVCTARRECAKVAAAQLQLTLLQSYTVPSASWEDSVFSSTAASLFAASGWSPSAVSVPDPDTPLGRCLPAILSAAMQQPGLLRSVLGGIQERFGSQSKRSLVLGGEAASSLSVKASDVDTPLVGWHVSLSAHTLSSTGTVESAAPGGTMAELLGKAIPEGTVICYRGVRSDRRASEQGEAQDEDSQRGETAALHAVGRAADAVAFMSSETQWVAGSKRGNHALRALGLPGGGTTGPRANDAAASALLELAAPVVLRCAAFDVEAVACNGSSSAAGAASAGVVASATPLPAELPLLLASAHGMAQIIGESAPAELNQTAAALAAELVSAAGHATTPSDVATAYVNAASDMLTALPCSVQEEVISGSVWPALERIVSSFALVDSGCNTAAMVASPISTTSRPQLESAAIESVKRTRSSGASSLHQAVARCASLVAKFSAGQADASVTGLGICGSALAALEWLAATASASSVPPPWLLQAAWSGSAWNALWRSLPQDTFPAGSTEAAAEAGSAAASAMGSPSSPITPTEGDDGDIAGQSAANGDSLLVTGERDSSSGSTQSGGSRGTKRRRATVQAPAVTTATVQAIEMSADNVSLAYAQCGDWSAAMDRALVKWASEMAANIARAAPEGSDAAGDASQLGMQLSISAFSGRSPVPDALANMAPVHIFARYSLLSCITSLVAACMPLLCPDTSQPGVQAAGSGVASMWRLEKALPGALPRLLPAVFTRWALHCTSATATSTTSIRPRIKLNRFSAGNPDAGMQSAIWAQTVRSLRWTMPHAMQLRQVRTAPHLAFEARLQGERVAGESGPYREVLDDCGRELAAHSAGGNLGFGMFQSTPNATGAYGEHRDCIMPSHAAVLPTATAARSPWVPGASRSCPLSTDEYFEGVGQLLAAAARTSAQVGVPFAPAVWQAVFGHSPSEHSLASVHAYLAENSISHLQNASDPDVFEAIFGDDLPASTSVYELSSSCEVLLRGGTQHALGGVVTAQQAPRFAAWLQSTHTAALQALCSGIRRGFGSVMPLAAVGWLTQPEATILVAGVPDIDVDLLQRNTQYSGGATAQSIHIQQFWRVLRVDFTPEQRQKFIKFAWGQSRLPANDAAFASNGTRLLIKSPATPAGDGSVDRRLPTADTCFFNVTLPPYSCYEAVRRQLSLVVSIGAGLDADAV